MSARIAVLLLACLFRELNGAVPQPEPQQWKTLLVSMEQQLTAMQRQLTVKDVRISLLETKLENHIAAYTKYVEDKEKEMQMKKSEIVELRQHVALLAQNMSETTTALQFLGKSIGNTEKTLDRENDEERPDRSEEIATDINVVEVLVSERYNVTHNDSVYNGAVFNISDSTEVDTGDTIPDDRSKPASQIRAVPYSPVAFHIELTYGITISTGAIVEYNHVTLDQGGGYTPGDGIYVVPETGTYVISWKTLSNNHQYIQTLLVVNGAERGSSFADSQEIHDIHQASALVVLKLIRGDHVFIRMGHTTGGSFYSSDSYGSMPTFSGWKLY